MYVGHERPVVAVYGLMCEQDGPHGMWKCTRPAGHSGVHVAHADDQGTDICAVWDDDRSTDTP